MAVKKKSVAKKRPQKKAMAKKRVATAKAGKKRIKKKASADSKTHVVTIKSDTGESANVPWGKDLQTLAMRWHYTLSRRSRWLGSSRTSKRLEAFEAVKQLIPASKIKAVLGKASLVEVQVPYFKEETGWEGRLAPWEFLISAAASSFENENALTIVRWLMTQNKVEPPAATQKVLYVQCAPGVLSDYFDFARERGDLERLFGGRIKPCINPTLSELRSTIASYKPTVIHLAGIDNNQARELLKETSELPEEWSKSKTQDGIVVTSDSPDVAPGLVRIDAETLSQVLNSGSTPVNLVTANVYHSAARICALAVAGGAGLAIGFQDTVNDALAEIFLREFYTSWLSSKDALTSFVGALDGTRSSSDLSGTGIVLWSAQSLLDGSGPKLDKARKNGEKQRETLLVLHDDEDFSKWFKVDIKLRDRLNYSMLHNASKTGGVFEHFKIRKYKEGILYDVTVEAILYLGPESHPYHSIRALTNFITELRHEVIFPLTSPLFRTVSEPMNTSLYVQVTVANKIVHRNTYRVTLLPVDEWEDGDRDRMWLPSFIFPRNPAVRSIIDGAYNHLSTLADNRNMGFDGYQNNHDSPEPMKDVDLQARAIWAAIVGDFRIRYINPPPSYSHKGQRIRTPTQIVSGSSGTCIDLALLFAGCLEYIDIYPVVFLLSGHAVAGYWRSRDLHDAFMDARPMGLEDAGTKEANDQTSDVLGLSSRQGVPPWILTQYDDILNEVNKGALTSIETTGVTKHGSFIKATAEGKETLNCRNAFDSMVDIRTARGEFITPLPMIE